MPFTLLSDGCNLPGCPAVWEDEEDLESACRLSEACRLLIHRLDADPEDAGA